MQLSSADQKACNGRDCKLLADDYRQITLAAHKRMDIIVGALLMLGEVFHSFTTKMPVITSGQTNNKLLEIAPSVQLYKPKSGDGSCGI